ncbi:MAG: adaptor protein MecA [Lachnospiraceae bacterium]|nr:adaptor protein MecA [Lachnospiraceae bacterium]
MKIERINDHQFRCVLSRKDLLDRSMKLAELAYGSPKARELFNEMMEKAYEDLGFEIGDLPVMVEAIPMPGEEIVLIISRVEDPDELDTRFSRFTPAGAQEESAPGRDGLDDLLSVFRRVADAVKDAQEPAPEEPADATRVFSFPDLDSVCEACRVVASFFAGDSALYKSPEGRYYLSVSCGKGEKEDFSRVLNILGEYGARDGRSDAHAAHFTEHLRPLMESGAVQRLARV